MTKRSHYRIIIFIVSFVAAGFSARDAALAYWRNQAALAYDQGRGPGGMPAYFVHDPAIEVIASEQHLAASAVALADLSQIEASASAAIRLDPLNATALYNLGMVAERRRAGSGLVFFRLTSEISRREVPNEIVLERLAARNGDLRGAISHIDHIVSVVPELAGTIFPSVIPSIANPDIRDAFSEYAQRPWYPALISAALDHGGDPDTVARLITKGEPFQSAAVTDGQKSALLAKVIQAGNFDAADRLVTALPAKSRLALAALGFSDSTTNPKLAPLAWGLTNDAVTTVHMGENGTLVVGIAAEQTGIVAVRTTLIAPGSYQLTQTIGYDAQAPRAGLTWDVTCAGTSSEPLWHQPIPSNGGSKVTYRSVLVIPAGCRGQIWQLRARGDLGQEASEVSVRDLMLAPS